MQGNITTIDDVSDGNDFEYDNLDRLKKVKDSTSSADVMAFTYDETGNRLSKKIGAGSTVNNTYGGSDHHLTAVGATSRSYDANGNTTQAASNQYFTYDERNRMVDFRTASGSGTRVSQYEYNDAQDVRVPRRAGSPRAAGKGERVRKYLGGTDQARYIYNEYGQLLVQTRISGSITQEILWLDDMPIGVSQNGTLHGILADHLNTPRQVFELGSQTVVWAWSSLDDAFGENVANEDPDANSTLFRFDMRFPGQLYDVESGLHYNYFRDYDAANGRYVESDPIGLLAGVSTYAYVNNSPLRKIDKYGLSTGGELIIPHLMRCAEGALGGYVGYAAWETAKCCRRECGTWNILKCNIAKCVMTSQNACSAGIAIASGCLVSYISPLLSVVMGPFTEWYLGLFHLCEPSPTTVKR